jgi:hypothetical protein
MMNSTSEQVIGLDLVSGLDGTDYFSNYIQNDLQDVYIFISDILFNRPTCLKL